MLQKVGLVANAQKALGNMSRLMVDIIKNLPDNAHVAGGIVRDIYHEKPFKDIDIVCGKGNTLIFVQAVLRKFLGNKISFELYGDADLVNNYVGGAITAVYKVVGSPIPIDIIVRRESVLTPLDVISNFDLSINQGVFIKHHEPFVALYNTSNYVTAASLRNIRPERIDKLKKKYPKLIWLSINRKLDAIKNPPKRDKGREIAQNAWAVLNGGRFVF